MSTDPPIDPNRPSAARIYDAYLGGTHNFAADRAIAARAVELLPEAPHIARANRAFLRRAVRYAAGRGIRQFLDLGSGIPTEDNVHQVARAEAPGSRVVYVDIDPTAVLYARDMLGDDPLATAVLGDLLRPEAVLADSRVRDLLDPGHPLAVLMVSVLHFVPDDADLRATLAAYREAAAPGSLLAISHCIPSSDPDQTERITGLYNRTGTPLVPRDAERVGRLFDGWRLVEPGLVLGPLWRPGPGEEPVGDPARFLTLAGVGVRR